MAMAKLVCYTPNMQQASLGLQVGGTHPEHPCHPLHAPSLHAPSSHMQVCMASWEGRVLASHVHRDTRMRMCCCPLTWPHLPACLPSAAAPPSVPGLRSGRGCGPRAAGSDRWHCHSAPAGTGVHVFLRSVFVNLDILFSGWVCRRGWMGGEGAGCACCIRWSPPRLGA